MKNDNKKNFIDSFIIGAALFAMFFGAGNMIFPPFLGLSSRGDWFTGFVGYYLADVGFAVMAMFAIIKCRGSDRFFEKLGKIPATMIMFAIVLCIGPVISIPRTAATTYELSIHYLAPEFSNVVFYVFFYLLVAFLSINKSKVVDIVGKFLTPMLFLGLMVLIIKGALTPIGEIPSALAETNAARDGIEAGYQTMDVLASTIFGILILNSAVDKGHTDHKEQTWVAMGASIVAGIGLLVVYVGLTRLGATAAGLYPADINRVDLLMNLVETLIPGIGGLIFFAIVAGLACVSTAIALISSSAAYFEKLSKGRITYRQFVIGISLFSGATSCLGVEKLIELAAPILNIVYPPVIIIVVLTFLGDRAGIWTHRVGAGIAMAISAVDTLGASFGFEVAALKALPLASMGFNWFVPSVIGCIAGLLIDRAMKGKNQSRITA